MNKIAQKKFEILEYVISDEFNIDVLADKLNELTNISESELHLDIEVPMSKDVFDSIHNTIPRRRTYEINDGDKMKYGDKTYIIKIENE